MKWPLVLRSEAERDIVSARNWYEQHREGLGDEFLEQIDKSFGRITDKPELFPAAFRDVRSCRLRRFPYLVYYRCTPERIEVLAVLHGSRDPSVWQARES